MASMKKPSGGGSGIAKETLIGLIAVVWGGYNLLTELNVIPRYVDTSGIQIVGNIMLIIAGLLLWSTAYRLWRYKFHTRGLF